MLNGRHSELQWRAMGGSVRGNSHDRAGLPNQDAILWRPDTGEGTPLIIALSDGHGSAKSFRSEMGAKFAVQVAVALVSEYKSNKPELSNSSAIKRMAEEQIPKGIVWSWQKIVRNHLEQNPFTEEDILILKEREGETAVNAIQNNPLLAYGATLLFALVTSQFVLLMQIGDGDIVVVGKDGKAEKPVVSDDRLFANATTSLCAEDAWKDFRFTFSVFGDSPPKMIMLSTDGYSNSFETEEGFLKIGTDIAAMIQDGKWDEVNSNLESWLADASRQGSGDDISLGILAPMDAKPMRFTIFDKWRTCH